jgi:nucleotide-binding universal stress UspA family protein
MKHALTVTAKRTHVTFRSILCPVDFSTHARDALRSATAIAKRFRGRVTVLFVNDPLLLAAGRTSYGDEREFLEQSRVELSRFVAQSVGGRQARLALVVGVGNPAEEILKAAKRLRADAVVMGTHGLSGVQRLFFGSTTEQVLRRAAVPVLAIPPKKGGRGVRGHGLTVDRVIAPIDLAGEWASDVTRAAALARAFDVALLLVHVLRPVQSPPWLRPRRGASDRERIRKAAHTLERVIGQLPRRVPSTCAAVLGDPAREIARLTRRGSPLLVMSLRGTGGVWGRRGSIAYRVLTSSSTPVLALPRRRLGGPLSARLQRAINDTLSARDRIEIAGIEALLAIASRERTVRR